jgi:3-oxoacyl-[acyl-carrier protein] reductase
VGTVEGIRRFFQALDAELTKRRGGNQFDILVNNAGIGRMGTVETMTEENFDELMAVNVKGPFFVAQQAIPRLREGGRIINLSSALSRHPYPQMAAYSMGKAAINHFTLILAAELGKRRITVNAIGPGLTVTDFTAQARQDPQVVAAVSAHTALGRLGEAEDIAGVAAWLASDDAGWVTGQYIEASGGSGLV